MGHLMLYGAKLQRYFSTSAVGALLIQPSFFPQSTLVRFDLISMIELHVMMAEHLQSNVSQDLVWEICRMFRGATTMYGLKC